MTNPPVQPTAVAAAPASTPAPRLSTLAAFPRPGLQLAAGVALGAVTALIVAAIYTPYYAQSEIAAPQYRALREVLAIAGEPVRAVIAQLARDGKISNAEYDEIKKSWFSTHPNRVWLSDNLPGDIEFERREFFELLRYVAPAK